MIDWSKLKPYQNDKRKSFEELCYQIAKKKYGSLGKFTSIDDSGGGDGVEFFLTLRDGTEWGWQAKFYHPSPRLDASRKRSIAGSLTTTLANHPTLKKWFLCTPTNFTIRGDNNELKWFDTTLQGLALNIELEHWGDSEFSEMLSDPQMVGKRNYFFGELELTPEWFKQQVVKQLANVREKFLPELHTETAVDFRVHCLLGDETFLTTLARCRDNIVEKLQEFHDSLQALRKYLDEDIWKDAIAEFLNIGEELYTRVNESLDLISQCHRAVVDGRIEEVQTIDLTPIPQSIKEHTAKYDAHYYSLHQERVTYGKNLSEEKKTNEHAQYVIEKIATPVRWINEISEILYNVDQYLNDLKKAGLQVFGNAGIGKTHITCNACNERVLSSLPALLLLGGQFTRTQTIEQRIRSLCDLPATYSWDDFLAALSSYAEAHRTKVLIAIDALNEAESIEIWRQELPGFIAHLNNSPWLVLVTTCRLTYQKPICGDHDPQNLVRAYGFGSSDLEEAITKYFDYYKLKADLTLAPLEQFRHPIYLKIFCESQNAERTFEKEVFLGQQTLFSVFEEFLTQVNKAVCRRLSQPPSIPKVPRALEQLAHLFWDTNDRHVRLEDVFTILDNGVDWERSFTKALLDEGLLITRDWYDDAETMSFTYDLLGGYLIAQMLLKGIDAQGLSVLVSSDTFQRRLTSDDYQERHPLAEDILRCICALVPENTGLHLNTLTPDQTIFGYSIDALFEMNAAYIGDEQLALIRKLFTHRENRKPLFRRAHSTIRNVEHPLNVEFWDTLLSDLPMPERDVSWTELIRSLSDEYLVDLRKFEHVCQNIKPLTDLGSQRLDLAARYFRWLLPSTNRLLRDTATRALYWYGRRTPARLFDLTIESLPINDPYIPERMLAASYGVTMTLHADPRHHEFSQKILPTYAHQLFDAMFAKNAPHATTHVLMRDFARHTIDLALLHQPNLLDKREQRRLLPPYKDGGIRKWGKSEDRNKGQYDAGSPPLQMDFKNYTLGRLVQDRANYDAKHSGYRKVVANIYWRIYDLGYSLETFGKIDQEIGRRYWRADDNGSRIDRYGKKYSWIAFYELYGFRQDKGLLKSRWSDNDERPGDVDIDPSFPGEPRKINLVTADFFGNRTTTLREWIEEGEIPDLTSYLVMDEIDGEPGPWVLLDGYVSQEDAQTKRSLFVFPRALMVSKHRVSEFQRLIEAQNLGGRWLPEIPESHYTFAGEIPWCETFPANGLTDFYFEIGRRSRKVPETQFRFFCQGREITREEVVELVERKLKPALKQRTKTTTVAKIFEAEHITVEEIQSYRDEEEHITRKSRVLIPVRQQSWESYHSGVNPGQHATVPAREIAEALDLWIQLPSWDMYDTDGHRAPISINWGESWRTRNHLTYIRQDLLERFLTGKRMTLLWAAWGEREIRFNHDEIFSRLHHTYNFQTFKVFQKIYRYQDGRAVMSNQSEHAERNRNRASYHP